MKIFHNGDTIHQRLKITYKGTGEPVDLSDYIAYSQMRATPGGEVVAEGDAYIDPVSGLVGVIYSSFQTRLIPAGEYGFDIRIRKSYARHEQIGDNNIFPDPTIESYRPSEVVTLYSTRILIKKAYTELEAE